MLKEEVTTLISVAEYQRLLVCQRELEALNRTGVDNWEGYDEAMKLFWELGGETL